MENGEFASEEFSKLINVEIDILKNFHNLNLLQKVT